MTTAVGSAQRCTLCAGFCVHDERLRLRLQAEALDMVTTGLLVNLAGARIAAVLEVGTGAETILSHLKALTPDARIWTTDVHARTDQAHLVEAYDDHRLFDDIQPLDPAHAGPLPPFDLVHVRCVLSCVPDRDGVLDRLCTLLAPHGLLLIEEFSALPPHDETSPVGVAIAAVSSLMTTALGADLSWTAQTPRWLHSRGLARVGAHAQMYTLTPDSDLTRFWLLTLDKWEAFLLEHHALTAAQIDDARRHLTAPSLWELSLPMISAWGYRA